MEREARKRLEEFRGLFEREPEVHPRLLDAPRTVLFPHIGSASQATRTKMARLAASGFHVIAIDMPGHGESVMGGPAPYIMTLGESAAIANAMIPFLLAAILFSYFGLQRRKWQQGTDND